MVHIQTLHSKLQDDVQRVPLVASVFCACSAVLCTDLQKSLCYVICWLSCLPSSGKLVGFSYSWDNPLLFLVQLTVCCTVLPLSNVEQINLCSRCDFGTGSWFQELLLLVPTASLLLHVWARNDEYIYRSQKACSFSNYTFHLWKYSYLDSSIPGPIALGRS